jgi:isocitrate dehydrogenase (NAD+)
MASRLLPRLARSLHSETVGTNLHKTPSRIKSEAVPVPLYGGRHLVTLLPGSGIGPEMTSHVRDVFAAAQVPVDFEVINGSGEELVRNAITSVRRNRVALKGNLRNVIDDAGFIAPNVLIRARLDLFVYVIHYRTYEEVHSKVPGLNLIILRQNTEGEYAMLEHESVKGVVESMKIVTRDNTQRFARFAFEHARKHGRRKVTAVHKSKQLELSDGMFLETIKEAAASYPDIQFEDIYIDRCCQKLVKKPHQFDVLLMPNLYGTIVSNVVCGLAGGAGLFSGINYGEDLAIFESATRHTGDTLRGNLFAGS